MNSDCQEFSVSPQLAEEYFSKIPNAFLYEGYIWQGRHVSRQRLQDLKKLKFCESDVIIATYPKSGTMWTTEIVSLLMSNDAIERVCATPVALRVPWLERKQTNGFEKHSHIYWTHLPLQLLPDAAHNAKIIYVARNPKDVSVSYHHWHTKTMSCTCIDPMAEMDISFNDFFQLFLAGKVYCGSWFDHVLDYNHFCQNSSSALFVKYENLKMDLSGEIEKIADFLGSERSEEERATIAHLCEFKNMKNNALQCSPNHFKEHISKSMRKGTIGDWKNFYTADQEKLLERIYKSKLKNTDLNFQFEENNNSRP